MVTAPRCTSSDPARLGAVRRRVVRVEWLNDLSAGELVLVLVGVFVGVTLVSALLTSLLVRVGIHTPMGIRLINRGELKMDPSNFELLKRVGRRSRSEG